MLSGALDFAELAVLDDVEATRRLVALPGIGPWSAEILLLRQMRRPDVFPSGDVALRRGLVLLDALLELPSPTRAAERAVAWRPFRSWCSALRSPASDTDARTRRAAALLPARTRRGQAPGHASARASTIAPA